LGQLKNPAPVAFVRQASFAAGPQQVNNGAMPEVSRSRETEPAPSKLLEAEHERMDARAVALAGRGDPAMAPEGGEIDRTKDDDR